MNTSRRISTVICILFSIFILSGCAERPFLTKDGHYSIVTISPDNTEQITPIELSWNSNLAVIQKLLLEASLVLGDLRSFPEQSTNTLDLEEQMEQVPQPIPSEESSLQTTPSDSLGLHLESSKDLNSEEHSLKNEDTPADTEPMETILLEAAFPVKKPFELFIDNEIRTLEISSVQIEVIGSFPGRVILNDEIILLGIPNPNLAAAFEEFVKMQDKSKEVTAEIQKEMHPEKEEK